MPIRCEVVSQDKVLYEGPADIVVAPAAEGEMGILPNHAPLLTTLDYGFLRVKYQGDEEIFTIAGGVMEVQPDIVTVMADVGENIADIDIARAQEAKDRMEKLLREEQPIDTDEYLAIQAALRRSQLRLDAVQKFRRRRSRPAREAPGRRESE